MKQERPFSDYPQLLKIQTKNRVKPIGSSYLHERAAATFAEVIGDVHHRSLKEKLAKAQYYSVLNDGSSDTSVSEKELVYVLFLDDGKPKIEFLSIEDVKNADAAGIQECIAESFQRIGITKFSEKMVGLNVDGASVNMGKFTGLGTRLKVEAPWLQVIHCFNHRLELALKDAFSQSPVFSTVDTFITKLYYLYQKSPKRLRCLRELTEANEKTIPKPTKAGGTRWLDFKYNAIKNVLENYGIYLQHIEDLANNDSQPKKREELKGHLKKWKEASVFIHMAIYLDVLLPLRRLSLSLQPEFHDPVKQIKRVQEFTWTMSKLKILIETSLGEGSEVITYYKKLLKDVKSVKESFEYQNIVLHNYAASSHNVEDRYNEIIINVSESMGSRFEDLRTSPVFSHLPSILDLSAWPLKDGINFFGETAINDLSDCFEDLLKKNGCDVDALNPEWMTLKTHMIPLIKNNQKEHYIDIWQRVMKSESIVNDCSNILHIIEILLCTPFSNAKLERMFSRMARVKTDYRNRLG